MRDISQSPLQFSNRLLSKIWPMGFEGKWYTQRPPLMLSGVSRLVLGMARRSAVTEGSAYIHKVKQERNIFLSHSSHCCFSLCNNRWPILYLNSAVFKVWSLNPWSGRLCLWDSFVRLTAVVTLDSPFLFSFPPDYIAEFSRGYMMSDITTDWMQKPIHEYKCLLLSQILKSFAEVKNNVTLLSKIFQKIWKYLFTSLFLLF